MAVPTRLCGVFIYLLGYNMKKGYIAYRQFCFNALFIRGCDLDSEGSERSQTSRGIFSASVHHIHVLADWQEAFPIRRGSPRDHFLRLCAAFSILVGKHTQPRNAAQYAPVPHG